MVAALKPEKTSPHDQKKLSTDIPRIPDDLKFNPFVDSALEGNRERDDGRDQLRRGGIIPSMAARATTPRRRMRRRNKLFPPPARHSW
jgi:hypothetical protein